MTTDIYDYMDLEEPTVKLIANVPHPTKDKVVGNIGEVSQRDGQRAYVSHRRRHGEQKGYFEKGEGYCISDSILRKLMRYDVQFVYIAETDTGSVHEFNINTFIDGIAFDEGDPQHCAPVDNTIKTWENHEPRLIK